MTTAFVLSGGGSLGAVQVGMRQTLADRGITPDLLIGASAGALNAALIEQRLILDVAAYHDQVELIVLPPLWPLAVSSADFRHARQLIARARRATHGWLDEGGHRGPHPERFLSLHNHRGAATAPADCYGGHAA